MAEDAPASVSKTLGNQNENEQESGPWRARVKLARRAASSAAAAVGCGTAGRPARTPTGRRTVRRAGSCGGGATAAGAVRDGHAAIY